jgi:prepilin-type processing-associated H-X9-DG protein
MHKSRPFTLIELLLVIVVIAILAAMLLPALNRAKRTGRVLVCMNNMKELAKGMLIYSVDFNHHWPFHPKTTGSESHPHQIWIDRSPELVYPSLGYNKQEWLDVFADLVLANSNIGWCPFERWEKPTQLGGLHYSNASTTIYNDDPGQRGIVVIGYARFAGFAPPGGPPYTADGSMDYANTENEDTTYAPLKPGTSADVILSELSWNNATTSLDAHADDPSENGHISTPHIVKYNENNVAFGDGHVEKHKHRDMTQNGNGNWYFPEDGHVIRHHTTDFFYPY